MTAKKTENTEERLSAVASSVVLAGRLGMAIRVVRLSKGMTLEAVSTKCGGSPNKGLLSRVENGDDNMEIRTLCKIAAALDTTVGRLIEAAS